MEGKGGEVDMEGKGGEVDMEGKGGEVDMEGKGGEVDMEGKGGEVDMEGKHPWDNLVGEAVLGVATFQSPPNPTPPTLPPFSS
ncbi:hypothetical protein Pcinc_042376 [Petrolisthes cinctipes]|uniref:Uncharacterized protein n=1 Tax=Petrolisthes cinctipes TaxID=88211 RepID=A0AAE1BI42_PETCI|nr:hypothetical protein Pcinc_042376 [Petrolisthes cinctipes]